MKCNLRILLLSLVVFGGGAFAHECGGDMKAIDNALEQGVSLTESEMSDVKELRAVGEELHRSKRHTSSAVVLRKAMEILGVKRSDT